MENGSFHNRLLSVMEVLAKAAVAEINRCVDDGCAVLRLEVSQSRRDIELLRRKCELMEAELRRNRMRARRKVFYPPAAERFSPLVRVVLSKDRQSPGWDAQMNAEASNQPQQHATDAEHTPVKKKCEEDVWQNGSEEKLNEQLPCFSPPTQTDSFVEGQHSAENPATPGSLDSTAEAVPEQQLNRNQIEAELVVKREIEEESDERTATFDSVHKFVTEGSDRQLWPANLCTDAIDPSFSYLGQQFEGIPSLFQSQSGHQGKSHSVAVSDKQSRTLSNNRLLPDEGYNALDQCLIPGQSQHQISDSVPPTKAHSENLPMPNTVATSFCPQGRSSYSLVRRMRAPWRSGIGEKRFSCTYCDKSFTRFSQLKEHLRSHTGEKPFSCLQCGRSFTKHCNLIRHAVVHSGEKPYGCSQCGKCFTQRSSLKSHQKTAH